MRINGIVFVVNHLLHPPKPTVGLFRQQELRKQKEIGRETGCFTLPPLIHGTLLLYLILRLRFRCGELLQSLFYGAVRRDFERERN